MHRRITKGCNLPILKSIYPSPPDITNIAAGILQGPFIGVTPAEIASEGVEAALIPVIIIS